jgi:hypothetical protein
MIAMKMKYITNKNTRDQEDPRLIQGSVTKIDRHGSQDVL